MLPTSHPAAIRSLLHDLVVRARPLRSSHHDLYATIEQALAAHLARYGDHSTDLPYSLLVPPTELSDDTDTSFGALAVWAVLAGEETDITSA